ncbi:MAG: sulfotransferase [Spirochaetales bacterium]|nr:sulfotransferase [Spirochaetales bacterium]
MEKPYSKPNFFIVGAARSGTTSLRQYLKQHPEIYFSPIKEPCHFCTDMDPASFRGPFQKIARNNYTNYLRGEFKKEIHLAWITDRDDYLALFGNVKNEKAIGEASVLYLFSTSAANEIYRFNPDAKIIIMLRNPVERAISHYKIDLNTGFTRSPITELIENYDEKNTVWGTRSLCLEMSAYYSQIKRFIDIFPKQQLRIYYYDDFIKDPAKIVQDVFSFLGVNSQYKVQTDIKYNPSSLPIPRSSTLSSLASKLRIKTLYEKIPVTRLKHIFENIYYKKKTALYSENIQVNKLLASLYRKDIYNLKKIIKTIPDTW